MRLVPEGSPFSRIPAVIRVGVAQGIGYLAAFAWNVVLARNSGVEEYGIFTFAFTIMTLLSLLVGSGASHSIVKFLSQSSSNAVLPRTALLTPVSLLGALIVGITLTGSRWSGPWYGLMRNDLFGISFMAFSLAVFAILGALFQATRRPASAALANPSLSSILILAAVIVATAETQVHAEAVIRMSAIFLIVPAVLTIIGIQVRSLRRKVLPGPQIEGFVVFGLKSMAIGLVYMGITHMDRLMLGIMASPTEVGIYGLSARIVGMMLLVVYLLPPLVAPIYASSGLGRDEAGGRVYEASTSLVARAVFPLALAFLLFGSELLELAGGESYRAGAVIVTILTLATYLVAATGNNGLMLQMGGRENWELGMSSATLGMNFLLNLVLIPEWGGVGAAYATAASLFISTVIKIALCRKSWGVMPSILTAGWFPVAVGGVVAASAGLSLLAPAWAPWVALLTGIALVMRPSALSRDLDILSSGVESRGGGSP